MRFLRVCLPIALTLVVMACGTDPQLETRTYQLSFLQAHDAEGLIGPYVYSDRPRAPGVISAIESAITVRETRDNLDKIERVLSEYDVAPPTVRLYFELIEANGSTGAEHAIDGEVEAELRKLFRFDGYRLMTATSLTAMAGDEINQMLFDEAAGEPGGDFSSFTLLGFVDPRLSNIGADRIRLTVWLASAYSENRILGGSVTLGIGHTIVLGTIRLQGGRGLILTVKAELADA